MDVLNILKWIFIAAIIIILILFTIGVIRGPDTQKIQNEISEINNQIANLKASVGNPGPQGPTGGSGPQGVPGPSGGIYQSQGPLRNLAYVDMFADRMFGKGSQAVPYLSLPNYRSQQQWSLLSNGKLENRYSGCLFGDTTTGLTYINNCSKSGTGMEWVYDNKGRLRLKGDYKKCLTPVYEGIFKNVAAKGNVNTKDKNIPPTSKFLQLKLNDCGEDLDQQWSFF